MNRQDENTLQEFYRLQKVEAELKRIEELDDLDNFKGKWGRVWRNRRTGKIYRSVKLSASEEEAVRRANLILDKGKGIVCLGTGERWSYNVLQFLYAEPVLE